ncbi:MAG TPA: hypothetical protein PK402_01180 [Tepidisphaeraceae bacterium]|nr:hypothetical protein [Tepidisphaeraceae bacterium]
MSAPAIDIELTRTRAHALAWRWPFVSAVIALIGHTLLWHPDWVLGKDSDVYLGVARSLLRGEGFMFNGNPAIMVQPLYPALLALGFWLGFDLGDLKLLNVACYMGYAALWTAILTRWTTPRAACFIAALASLLSPVTFISSLFFTDALFAMLAAATLLLAMQIAEGKPVANRFAFMLLLLGLAHASRAAGLIWMIVPATTLLSNGRWRRRLNWLLPIGTIVFVIALHLTINSVMKHYMPPVDPKLDNFLGRRYEIINDPTGHTTFFDRALRPGKWVATLLIEPLARNRPYSWPSTIAGTIFGGFCAYFMIVRARLGDWVLLGAAAYGYAICLNWTNVIGRYWFPIAPLVMISGWLGWQRVIEHMRCGGVICIPCNMRAIGVVALIGMMVVNLFSYVLEIRVSRSPNPLTRHDGGANVALVQIADMLRDKKDGVAISHTRINRNRSLQTLNFLRAFHLLIDRPVYVPQMEMDHFPDRSLADWMIANKLRYYVFQPETHITFYDRGKMFDPRDDNKFDMDWRLYEIDKKRRKLVRIPITAPPRRVAQLPGLQRR